jgi:ribonuclease P protein component
MHRLSFKKSEHLTSKRTFEQLFSKGKSFSVPPFRVLWIQNPASTQASAHSPIHLGISVPKRSFSKAVLRNRLKRRIREAYRKNKHEVYEVFKKKNLSVDVLFIYTAKEELPYSQIEQKMIVSLHKLIAVLQ